MQYTADGVAREAASILASAWMSDAHLEAPLPQACRPRTRAEGYAAQALWASVVGHPPGGWKIAATSVAGQKHIGVSGPLAGPIFRHRIHPDGAAVSLAHNRMRVAECEVVFIFGRDLTPQAAPRSREEVLAAVSQVSPGIEVPDSRFVAFESAGEAQLLADCACCNEMVLGTPVAPDASRLAQMPQLRVQARVSDGRTPDGLGSNVLGDPVEALVWFVHEMGRAGQVVRAGEFVTTGACVPPIPVLPGQTVEGDFGWIGRITARFTD
jgi:2-keto-4-pentenoate hydratase